MKKKAPRIDNEVISFPLSSLMERINERYNSILLQGREDGNIIKHNLEYGIGAENVFKALLKEILPFKYGVGKGKLVNEYGQLSTHLDVIIFDHINYPSFYVDKNKNIILPIEAAYAVIEVKSKTNAAVLKKAYNGLKSVSDLCSSSRICTHNNLVDYRPPALKIFSFEDDRTLDSIKNNFIKLSNEFERSWSFQRFSKKSAGKDKDNLHHYLVNEIIVIGLGSVFSMLDGSVGVGRWSKNTFGMFISGLLSNLNQINLGEYTTASYMHWLGSGIREVHER